MDVGEVAFDDDGVRLFARASGDENPLHVDASYARRSVFGTSIVHGALACLAALGEVPARAGRLSSLQVELPGPVFRSVPYACDLAEDGDAVRVRMHDGRRDVLRMTARWNHDARAEATTVAAVEQAERSPPRSALDVADLTLADVRPGMVVRGQYRPDLEALEALQKRYRLDERGVGVSATTAIALCSHLVGMRLPGKRALFSAFELELGGFETWPVHYELTVCTVDDRFGLVSMTAVLRSGERELGTATLRAFVRSSTPEPSVDRLAKLTRPAKGPNGRVALVTGGSRGLGASLCLALALRGYDVIGTCRQPGSDTCALEACARGTPGKLSFCTGDIAAEGWGSRASGLVARRGRLDLLVCNACPPLEPLWLEPAATPRIATHVARALTLVAVPLAQLLPLLDRSGGTALVVSSTAVLAPVPEWPHYVAAKCAIEGLARSAALEYPKAKVAVCRPRRLLTELTNTPLGRIGAVDPDTAATELLDALDADERTGFVVLDTPTG